MKLSERQQILGWCLFLVVLAVIQLSFHVLQCDKTALKILNYNCGDEGSKVLQNVINSLPINMMLYFKRLEM
jgi:hypothetical protein